MEARGLRRVATPEDVAAVEGLGRAMLEKTHSVLDLLADAAEPRLEAPALIFLRTVDDPAPVIVTFGALLRRIRATAALFGGCGIGPDDVVSILLPSIPQAHFALWGAMAAGIANPLNALLSRAALAAQLRGTRTKLLIALGPSPASDMWQRVAGLEHEVPTLETILQVPAGAPADPAYDNFDTMLASAGEPAARPGNPEPHRTAVLFHTGGSTGAPRVVKLSHRNLIAAAWSLGQSWGYSDKDILVNGLPLFHVGGAIDCGLASLAAGGAQVMPTPTGLRNPEVVRNFWKLAERFKFTIVGGVPTSIAALANVPVDADISSVQIALTGGSACPTDTGRKFEALTGVRLHEIYGMTESSGVATTSPRHGTRQLGSAGIRMPLVEVFVAADEHAVPGPQALPTGQGEIWLRGPNVFAGYLDPAHDAGTVLGKGWIASGDLGRIDAEGYLWITGRKKDIIIRSAHNIDPLAIEEVAAAYPGVVLASAVGQPDSYAGEVPVLYVTAAPGVTLDIGAMMAFLVERLAEPPARPREIIVVQEMPLTPLGKIFKPALRIDAAERVIRSRLAECSRGHAGLDVKVSHDRSSGLRAEVVLTRLPDPAACAVLERAAVAAIAPLPISHQVIWRS